MPYTIVLTPPREQAAKYIEVSQDIYSAHKPHYILNKLGTSSPHITVIQFDCNDKLAENVWEEMCKKMSALQLKTITPQFTGMAYIEGAGAYEGTTWVELSVNRGDINSPIMQVHLAALEALKTFNVKALNASDFNYRPHLTLSRIVMPELIKMPPKDIFQNESPFYLEFGLSDECWQYAKTLSILKS